MLKEILRLIYEKRFYSKSYISKELNISEDMVESAIDQLLERNYLKEDQTSNSCGSLCSSCPMANCSKNIIKTYSLTEKGLKTLS